MKAVLNPLEEETLRTQAQETSFKTEQRVWAMPLAHLASKRRAGRFSQRINGRRLSCIQSSLGLGGDALQKRQERCH